MSAFKKRTASKTKESKNVSSHIIRRDLTDNQSTAIKLRKALDVYPFASVDTANSLRDKVADIETLKYMNMSYLAGALYIFEMLQERVPTAEEMKTESEPMLTVLRRIILESGKDSEKDIIKYKEVLLTYIIKIAIHVSNNKQS